VLTDSAKKQLDKAALAFKKGDKKAFDVIFRLAGDPVFRICRHIVGTFHEAEDVMQEVFMNVYTSLPDFRGESSLFTWLYTVARNKSLNYIKKKDKKEKAVLDGETFQEIESSEDDNGAARQKELDLMHECIQELPADFKSAIVLRDIEGLTYDEISQIEEIPVGTVRSRLNRGRAMLQEMFFLRRGT
jgi:RNA polymerase sigma-70 factor (ECF subfamily)